MIFLHHSNGNGSATELPPEFHHLHYLLCIIPLFKTAGFLL
jgi:hypothetical protein